MPGALLCKQSQTCSGSALSALAYLSCLPVEFVPSALDLPSSPQGLGPAGSSSALGIITQNPCTKLQLWAVLHKIPLLTVLCCVTCVP